MNSAVFGNISVAASILISLSLAACASEGEYPSAAIRRDTSGFTQFDSPPAPTREASIETPDQPLQCVPYARTLSGIDLYGDAANWWELAAGRYGRSNEPSIGAVLVLTGSSRHGHVAVVTAIDSAREIRVDHANWLNDGRIYHSDPVVDVSSDNDWSEVRVWDARDNVLGSHIYSVRGFIAPAEDREGRVASRD